MDNSKEKESPEIISIDEDGNISIVSDPLEIKLIIGNGEEPTKQKKGGPVKKKKRRHKKPKGIGKALRGFGKAMK
mgnify:CR=1 FL=1|tara:strand:+ start:52 stop:276 length:225 start_codon:yes stop_codon:yes gene_type:complete